MRDRVAYPGSREGHVVAAWDSSANEVLERAAEAGAPCILVVDPTIDAHHGPIGLVAAGEAQAMLTLRLAAAPRSPVPVAPQPSAPAPP